MKRTRILVVDDEPSTIKLLQSNLRVAGYDVLVAARGEEALALAADEPLDLVILDLMLPGIDGFETCRRLRATSGVPIIVLSAKGDVTDKIEALNLGADDYLTKPFSVEELFARARAVFRRSGRDAIDPKARLLSCGSFMLDPETQQVALSGREIDLTPTEFNLLHYLMEHAGKVVQHDMLLSKVWGVEYCGQTEYLRVYVGRLRQKIERDPANPVHILTKSGVGYLFQPDTLPSGSKARV